MTIQEALDRVDLIRPNGMKKEFKIAALAELDGIIYRELVTKHRRNPGESIGIYEGYTDETEPGTILLAPFPYDELYTYWLCCKVDYQNLEMDKYNNDRTMFNNAYEQLSDYWTRTRMPLQRNRELRI